MMKHGLGADRALVTEAAALADSLLSTTEPDRAHNPVLMSSLAAVTGRAGLAAEYLAQASYEQSTFPEQLDRAAARYAMTAASGGPGAQALRLEDELGRIIAATRMPDQALEARFMFMERGAVLGFPDFESRLYEDGHPFQSPIGRAQAAWRRGEPSAALGELADLAETRQGIPPSGMAIDIVYPEARLRLAMGDSAEAIGLLSPPLSDVRWIEPGILREDPVRAAVLLRSLSEAAELGSARVPADCTGVGPRPRCPDGPHPRGRAMTTLRPSAVMRAEYRLWTVMTNGGSSRRDASATTPQRFHGATQCVPP